MIDPDDYKREGFRLDCGGAIEVKEINDEIKLTLNIQEYFI